MNVDRYTKAVLTVIAGCLLWMCVMGAGPALQAERRAPEPTQVKLTDMKTIAQPVILVGTGAMDLQGRISVTFNDDEKGRRTDPTLAVRVEDAPLRQKPGPAR